MSPEVWGRTAHAGLAAAVSVLLASCTSAGPSDPADAEHRFETVVAESYSGLVEPRRAVVQDEAAWSRLWAEIHAVVDPPPRPPVDFARDMLIVVAAGTRPSGGFAIRVRKVATRGDTLEVTVLESCPAPGATVTLALSQPVEVVRVPRLATPARFRDERTGACP